LRRVFDAGDDIRIGTRADFPAFVGVTDQLAVALGAEPDVMPCFGAIGRDGKSLRTRWDEFHRSFEPFRGKRNHCRSGVIVPFEPNAPPAKCETVRTFSGSIASRSATLFFNP
jgi:hypothetical protein